ncbi:condensin subunit Smc [Halanaerobium saccharolyticum]|uniref:Chromosome partition protein Smc n=1 Tax=Halanaerobium saccharolyticum TaxID=43595 RepID=A0A4R7ZA54_9FIRM|nr:condensin subunit Smc [Halanaerobium saccharolyticum]TDW06932.1 condensin subunit Smc [Halanaerobium saccharolyticum]TDX63697.1 condensin subunit Smc [Halanaerobium saccharolyticum]
MRLVVNIFLKKIRLKGFKSFANKTDIEIEENITAVVGPNGSGKSNIVDAIRWVLGEQSAKNLRGSRMADIIFSGSEELNAKKKASVTLFFDNSNGDLPVEGKELTLGRQVSDDGRSDYLINGASCRLKDIEMLLMDSGLGSDGYSIVGQGRIDSIIKSKPDKMRLFFEEAAGIMKHKSRKEDAEKRLDNTNNDLNRIHDLVDELEKRHDPLAKAAEKAKKYKDYKNQLSDLEISLLNKQWKEHSEEFSQLSQKRESAEKKLNEKESSYNALSYQLDNSKDKLKSLKNEKEEVSNNYFQNQNKVNEINNNLNVMEERKNNYIENKENLTQKITDLKKDRKLQQEKVKQAEDNFELINSDQQNIQAEIDKLKKNINQNNEQIESLSQKIKVKENEIEANKKKIQDENSALERLKERVEISNDRLQEISADQNQIDDKMKVESEKAAQIKKELAEIREQITQKESDLDSLKENIDKEAQALEAGKDELLKTKEDYQHYNSRLQLMEEMQESYEGYYNGVRSLLEQREKFSGIIDVVAEIVSVKAEFEQAIETALGAKMQNIIVEDDQTARDAVKYLKQNKKGRATFLPLNMVNGSRLGDHYLEKLAQQKGFIGLAVDLVDFPDRLENVFNFLLGQIVVSDNLNHAVQMSKNIKRNFRVVTTEGDVVYPGGAISGGSSSSNSRDLIGRSRKIEDLKTKKSRLQQKGKALVEKLETNKKELDQKREKLEALKSAVQSLKMEENNIINRKNRVEETLLELKSDKDLRQNNFSELDNSLKNNKDLIKIKEKKINELKEKNKSLNLEINDLKAALNIKEENLTELEPQLKELELDGARISEKRNNAQEKLKEAKRSLELKIKEINNKEEEIKEISSDLERISDRRVKMQQKKKELESAGEDLKQKKEELTIKVKNLEKEVEVKEKKAKELQQQLNKIKDDFHQLDLKYTKLDDKLTNIKSILLEDYNLKPTEIDESDLIEIKDEDEAEVESKIKSLKKKMDSLHPVNEAAVEEFAELKERLDYLHEQQDDLKHARNSIELVISDIEESMEKMFAETFYQVKEEFSKVFKALFQGGKAELKLSEPEELLTTGVEIHAQPPGKSLKSLSLLSGGERALTAIALIFAFIQVKPSPFYVLDEIDAPLDDVNIVRFASFIKKYAKVAQFIIITHRRYMMTEVDSLYGVTMEKSGVSRLVSLKLDQAEEFNDEYIKEAL